MDDHRRAEARHRRRRRRVGDRQLHAVAVRRRRRRRRRQRDDGSRARTRRRPRSRSPCRHPSRPSRPAARRAAAEAAAALPPTTGAVDVVRVDVDRDAAVRLLVTALVLMHALVVRPERVADVRVAEDVLDAVPVRDPRVVGLRRSERGDVTHRRRGAAVDTGDVTLRVQLAVPGGDERLHGLRARRVVALVALHVEVDRAARRQPEVRRARDRVVGRGAPLVRPPSSTFVEIFCSPDWPTHGACSPT